MIVARQRDRSLGRGHGQVDGHMRGMTSHHHIGVEAGAYRLARGMQHQVGPRRRQIEAGCLVIKAQPRIAYRKAFQ